MSQPRSRLLAVLLVVAALGAFSLWPRGSGPTPPLRAERESRGGRAARAKVSASEIPAFTAQLDPGELPDGVERNIFVFYNTPIPTPTPPPPTPTPFPAPCTARYIGPCPPTPTPAPTPIIPPKVPFKVTGRFGPRERPILALEDGNRLISAREGDILDNKFILRRVNRESVDFGFVGLPKEITTRLPMSPDAR